MAQEQSNVMLIISLYIPQTLTKTMCSLIMPCLLSYYCRIFFADSSMHTNPCMFF